MEAPKGLQSSPDPRSSGTRQEDRVNSPADTLRLPEAATALADQTAEPETSAVLAQIARLIEERPGASWADLDSAWIVNMLHLETFGHAAWKELQRRSKNGEFDLSTSPWLRMPDPVLAYGVQAGVKEALTALVVRYHKKLANWLSSRFSVRQDDLEDALQDLWTKITSKMRMGTLRIDGNPGSFLYKVSQNLIYDRHRKVVTKTKHVPWSIDDRSSNSGERSEVDIPDSKAVDPERQLLSQERQQAMEQLVSELREYLQDQDWTVLWLRFAEDLSSKQVGVLMDRSAAWVDDRVHKLREKAKVTYARDRY
jgi:RNA polymerase sigma factor (sigma-70 family)